MIRLALIGCSDQPEQYAAAVSRLQNAAFVAVADADADRANRAAKFLKVSIVADRLDELLTRHADAFDAVLIQTAGGLQADQCQQAAVAGKHVLAESPLAPSTAVADAVIADCRAADVRLMVGQASRFLPSLQTVKSSLESGVLGAPGLLRIHRWESRETNDGEPWMQGVLQERVVREIDLANWLFQSPPREIYAVARSWSNPSREVSDYVQLHLGFEGGGMALIDYSTTIPRGEGYFSLSMIGSAGAAYADDHHNMQLLFGGRDNNGRNPTALKTQLGYGHLLTQVQEFASAIEDGREPAITGADGRLAVQVAEAAAASISERRAARLNGGRYELV